MNPFSDRAALEQTSFDSALPSGTAVVVHRFDRRGRYAMALSLDGRQVVETRTIFVGDEADEPDEPDEPVAAKDRPRARRLEPPRPERRPGPLPLAVAVDLGRSPHLANAAAPPDVTKAAVLGEGGYATFTAPSGHAHRVVVTRVGPSGEAEKEFDSTRLGSSDIFAVTLFRPGTYTIANAVGGHEARLVVTYPQVGPTPYRPGDPVTIHSRDGGFEPTITTVGPGQGVIFEVTAESRITIELLEPDDGPGDDKGGRRPLARRHFRPVARPGAERRDSAPESVKGDRGTRAGGGAS